uniref:Pheromone receptor a1 n=1 Tax=Ustanciosporium gigantosporum TaxID=1134041 RepID=H2CZ25_9BASI|nr:pheromone receptor a1 [Ustanciosporium gigantosporum]
MIDHVVPPFALISCFLVLLPLSWHIKSGNTGTIALAAWLFLGNLDIFINSMIWWSNYENKAPWYCEISIRLRYCIAVAIPACNLAIARRLESIASTRQVRASLTDKKRQLWIELFITVGVPVIYVALMIVNQSYRYNIIEEFGCWPAMWPSWVWILLSVLPCLCISIASFVYSVLSFRWFWIRRRQFQAVLASSASTLNKSRYIRMLTLTSVDMLFFFPIYFGGMIRQVQAYSLLPYTSWSYVHAGFNRYEVIPAEAVLQQPQSMSVLLLSRWMCPVSAIIFFAMFGLGQEARQAYADAFGLLTILNKMQKRRSPKPMENVTVDIEVVTFHQHDRSSEFDASPRSDKFGTNSEKFSPASSKLEEA